MKPKIEIIICDEKAQIPTYATEGSAAVDLRACIAEPLLLMPHTTTLVPTGLKMHINDPNYAAKLLPRSSLGHKFGIVLGNGTGLIDSDYQGEIMVSLRNYSNGVYKINPDDRIAQMVIIPVVQVDFSVVSQFSANTVRAEGGFGSTGVS